VQFVVDGHGTDTPISSIHSGLVSLPGIRIVTALAELNDARVWGTGIGNTYPESAAQEKTVFMAGEEFGNLAGHLFQMVKALYGLKSSGKR
jgi:hypothetical protein